MYPSQGSMISLSLTLTPPYSAFNDMDYATAHCGRQRTNGRNITNGCLMSRYYLPLDNKKKLVLEAKAHFGFIGAYNLKKTGIGPFERFVLGGSGLAGGFNSFVLGKEIIGLQGLPG